MNVLLVVSYCESGQSIKVVAVAITHVVSSVGTLRVKSRVDVVAGIVRNCNHINKLVEINRWHVQLTVVGVNENILVDGLWSHRQRVAFQLNV